MKRKNTNDMLRSIRRPTRKVAKGDLGKVSGGYDLLHKYQYNLIR